MKISIHFFLHCEIKVCLHQVEVVHDGEGEEEAVESSLVLHLHFKHFYLGSRIKEHLFCGSCLYVGQRLANKAHCTRSHVYVLNY